MKMLFLRRIAGWIILPTLFTSLSAQVEAAIRLPKIIGDHMVLQCDQKAPIWGWAEPHERVTVQLGGQTLEATAADGGKWSLQLESLAVNSKPMTMTVRGSSGSTVTVNDILVGEVWVGSGQSNMVMEAPFDRRKDPPPTMRIFQVAQNHSHQLLDDVDGQWSVASTESLAKFSWVMYGFGKNLHEALHVPVGLVQSTWGGTPIQGWMPARTFTESPLLAADLKLINDANAEFDQLTKDFAAKRQTASKGQTTPSPSVAEPRHPFSNPGSWPGYPTILYNAMIHPLSPYGIRGFLWYQGENNVFDTKPEIYGVRMKAMIDAWRARWNQPTLPFYFVQLPPFHYTTTNDPLSLTKLWQGQVDVLKMVSDTAIAPTMDLGDINDIHPWKKDEVGERLSLIALRQTYGRTELTSCGPIYDSHVVEAGQIRVRFRDVGSGLISRDRQPLTWFQLAGDGQTFVDAAAEIASNDTVVVKCLQVPKPIAVRFGWNNVAQPNLANGEGLPALPFSTIRW